MGIDEVGIDKVGIDEVGRYRLQLRVKLSNPHNFSSFAALATMGMLFSFIVVFFWIFVHLFGHLVNILAYMKMSCCKVDSTQPLKAITLHMVH